MVFAVDEPDDKLLDTSSLLLPNRSFPLAYKNRNFAARPVIDASKAFPHNPHLLVNYSSLPLGDHNRCLL